MAPGSAPRATALWLAVTALAVATCWWAFAGIDLTVSFDRLVPELAAVALGGCSIWAWLVTGVVVLELRRGRVSRLPGVPRWARRAIALACGAALLGAVPAHADDQRPAQADHPLSGLPYPDRPVGPASAAVAPVPDRPAPRSPLHVVAPGESLWVITERHLGPHATLADVARGTEALYRHHAAAIGADPDLIHPGLRLNLDPLDRHRRG